MSFLIWDAEFVSVRWHEIVGGLSALFVDWNQRPEGLSSARRRTTPGKVRIYLTLDGLTRFVDISRQLTAKSDCGRGCQGFPVWLLGENAAEPASPADGT